MPPVTGSDDESSGEEIQYSKAAKREPHEDNADEEEDTEDLDEDEYVVEKILAHRFDKQGTLSFEVQWQGWEESTWEPEENLDGCQGELNEYYKEIGGKPAFKAKTSRASAPASASKAEKKRKLPASITRETPPSASKRGRVAKNDIEETANSVSGGREWVPPTGSWENSVSEVLTLERDERGVLFGVVMWNNDKKTKHMTSVLNAKCPQKMIEFYESHLQFNAPPPTQDPASAPEETENKATIANADTDDPDNIFLKSDPVKRKPGTSNGDYDEDDNDAEMNIKSVAI